MFGSPQDVARQEYPLQEYSPMKIEWALMERNSWVHQDGLPGLEEGWRTNKCSLGIFKIIFTWMRARLKESELPFLKALSLEFKEQIVWEP